MFRHVLHHVTTSQGHLFAFAFSRDDGTCLTFSCDVTNSFECLSTLRSDDDWDLFVKADATLEGIKNSLVSSNERRFNNFCEVIPSVYNVNRPKVSHTGAPSKGFCVRV